MAIICLGPGEPPEYEVRNAADRLELADDVADVPATLLRPFYMRDLKAKYAGIDGSPYREYYTQLIEKVQSRLDTSQRVYGAFYSDRPGLAQTVARAVGEGASRVILLHLRVSDPPDAVPGELLKRLDPGQFDLRINEAGPLWDTNLLPQVYVRRVLETMAQLGNSIEELGLLLIGRGHPVAASETSKERHRQEETFQRRVNRALQKVGFDERQIEICWLRHGYPTVPEALERMVKSGCKAVYWMPTTYPADGVNTLFDIPAQMAQVPNQGEIKLVPLGAWNADDLAAQEVTSRVRAAVRVAVR